MALLSAVVKETSGLLARLGLQSDNMLQTNFRQHGAELGFDDFEDYKAYAERIYIEAMRNPEAFTIIDLPKSRIAIDFQYKMRGIYNEFGNAIAFFKPQNSEIGYTDPAQELRDFAQSVHSLH